MRKLIHIIIILLFAACSSYTGHHEIIVNKTVKVFSKEYHNKSEDYIFKWNPPIGPNNKVIPFDLKDDMLLFTPIQVGDYQIHLSITNISNEIIAEEMFYFRAVAKNVETAITESKIEKIQPQSSIVKELKHPSKKSSEEKSTLQYKISPDNKIIAKKKIENVNYTIQIVACPSLEKAHKEQMILIESGFDAYIQRHYREDKDAIWYRVRIGNFSNRKIALTNQKQIDSIMAVKSWLVEIPLDNN